MYKSVFRSGELYPISDKVILEAPFPDKKKEDLKPREEDLIIPEVYMGPTAEDLRREAEAFKVKWANEKEQLISSAQSEASVLVNDAKKTAAELETNTKSEIEKQLAEAAEKAESILQAAKDNAKQIEDGKAAMLEAEKKSAHAEGVEEGKKEGAEAGMAEITRLIERTQVILKGIQDKRSDILNEAEQQIVDLAIMISRKVIKTISTNQREVVCENIKEALSKVKTKGKVFVKVNLADLELSTERIDEFNKMIEAHGNIQIMEDSSVDSGGCVVETDFGEIDARISSQLAELEAKIQAISPIKGSA